MLAIHLWLQYGKMLQKVLLKVQAAMSMPFLAAHFVLVAYGKQLSFPHLKQIQT